jgi:hypothetical protein
MATKTKFVKFIGACAINGHQIEVREQECGGVVLRHERHGKHSGVSKVYGSIDQLNERLEKTELSGAQLLNIILGEMGVTGFPAV